MSVQLYINGREVDIDRGTSIPFNFEAENLNNPTIIKNSFSKTVSLPATSQNNEVFNHIWNLDQIHLDFDPKKRTDFVLTSYGSVVTTGYMRLDSIDYSGPYQTAYNVTLFGGLGDFFYSLSEEDKYLERLADNEVFAENFKHRITAQRVENSWTESDYYKYILSYSGQYNNFENDKLFESISDSAYEGLKGLCYNPHEDIFVCLTERSETNERLSVAYFKLSEGILNVVDIDETIPSSVTTIIYDVNMRRYIAWAPGNTILCYSDVNSISSWNSRAILTGDSIIPYANIVDITNSLKNNGTEPTIWIVDAKSRLHRVRDLTATQGTEGWQIYDLSGGLTNPPATVNGRVLVYEWANNNTTILVSGYDTNRQIRWARLRGNTFLPVTSVGNMTDITIGATVNYSPVFLNASFTFYYTYENVAVQYKLSDFFDTPTFSTTPIDAGLYTFARNSNSSTDGFICGGNIYGKINVNGSIDIYRSSGTPEVIGTAMQSDGTNYVMLWHDSLIGTSKQYISYTTDYQQEITSWTSISGYFVEHKLDDSINEHQRNEFRSYYQRPCLRLKHIFTEICNQSGYEVILDPAFFNANNPYWEKTWIMMERLTVPQIELDESKHGNIRTGDEVTFELMVKNGVTQSDFIISYCMMFGLKFEKDKMHKKIYIWDRKTFFSDYKIVDWSEKIDYNKASKLTPLVFDYKYAQLKWSDSETQYEVDYITRYNREYGRLQLDTGYDFNSNENNLIAGNIFQNIVISQDYDVNFEDRNALFKYRDDKILPAAYTKKNNIQENTDLSMVLLFDAGMQTLNKTAMLTDDTEDMKNSGIYSWTDSGGIPINSIPLMLRVANFSGQVYSLDFARPEEIYYPVLEYPDTATIYARYWEKYLSERLSDNTRVYNTYFYITEPEINQFRFNTFVIIDNTLWYVNKISDFDITKDASTKVELVRVKDLSAYTG